MNREIKLSIDEQASAWAEQLRTDSSFTGSDVEELKSHLIDLSEELKLSGLNEEEAFVVAASRLDVTSTLKYEFEEVNLSVIQLRKTILILSGILLFFLLYYFIISSTRMLFLVLHDLIDIPALRIKYVFYYVIIYHIFIVVSTLFLYFFGEKMVKRIEMLRIKPLHTFLLFSGIIVLALTDWRLRQLIREVYGNGFYTSGKLYTIFDYLVYSYPLVIIICFIVLFKEYNFSAIINKTNFDLSPELLLSEDTSFPSSADYIVDERLRNQLDLHLKELKQIPLSEEEAYGVAKMRMGMDPWGNYRTASNLGYSMRNLMIVLSGVLLYFLLHFLMVSSARILFIGLQHFENDLNLNIRRTWLFVVNFQVFFVFLTAGLYFLDKHIVGRLNRVLIKPFNTFWLLFATILLAIVDRSILPIAKNTIGRNHIELMNKFFDIFITSDYTFPFILCACFLVLFYKYYRDHVRIGN